MSSDMHATTLVIDFDHKLLHFIVFLLLCNLIIVQSWLKVCSI